MNPEEVAGTTVCTIVVPCFNEVKRLAVQEFEAFCSTDPHIKFLFVNDGSGDGTLEVLQLLKERCPRHVDFLNKEVNQGKAEAVRSGLLHAIRAAGRPKFVGYLDADLATPLNEMVRLLSIFEAHPEVLMLLGSRVRLMGRSIRRRAARHYSGRIFATLASLTLELPVYDTQCGAKLLRVTPTLAELLSTPFISKWVFDVELLSRLLATTEALPEASQSILYEEPLLSWRDVDGSKLNVLDSLRSLIDLVRIRRAAGKGQTPLSLDSSVASDSMR